MFTKQEVFVAVWKTYFKGSVPNLEENGVWARLDYDKLTVGIDNEKKLESALRVNYETFETGWGASEPITIGGKIANALRSIDFGTSSGNQDWGIRP